MAVTHRTDFMVCVSALLACLAPMDAVLHLREAAAALSGTQPTGTRIERFQTQVKRLEKALPSLRRAIEFGRIPETADFAVALEYRPIGLHLVAAIELDLIEGRHRDAAERIAMLDSLQEMQRSHSIIGHLVVIAIDAVLVAALETHFDRLSLPLAAQLRRTAGARLRTDPLKEMFRRERGHVPTGPAWDQLFSEVGERLDRPERAWLAPLPLVGDDPEDQPIPGPVMEALVRHRTQWRLVDLAARASESFWREGRYPQALSAFAPGTLGSDPASGKPFIYELTERGFRLRSETGVALPRPPRITPAEPGVP